MFANRLLILFVLLLGIVAPLCSAKCAPNGTPDCLDVQQLNRSFRNFWNPTCYWQCTALHQQALLVRCPSQTGYLASAKACVKWIDWHWERPICEADLPQATDTTVIEIIP